MQCLRTASRLRFPSRTTCAAARPAAAPSTILLLDYNTTIILLQYYYTTDSRASPAYCIEIAFPVSAHIRCSSASSGASHLIAKEKGFDPLVRVVGSFCTGVCSFFFWYRSAQPKPLWRSAQLRVPEFWRAVQEGACARTRAAAAVGATKNRLHVVGLV